MLLPVQSPASRGTETLHRKMEVGDRNVMLQAVRGLFARPIQTFIKTAAVSPECHARRRKPMHILVPRKRAGSVVIDDRATDKIATLPEVVEEAAHGALRAIALCSEEQIEMAG